MYLSLHCHHQNDSCIKMGSDESHFNVSLGSDGQSHNPARETDRQAGRYTHQPTHTETVRRTERRFETQSDGDRHG